MIKLDEYSNTFEIDYYNVAIKKIEAEVDVDKFVFACKKFISKKIINSKLSTDEYLKKLILLPHIYIKEIVNSIGERPSKYIKTVFKYDKGQAEYKMREVFENFYGCYEKIRNSQRNGKKMSVRMVNELGITVCPYCNRDYINTRSDLNTGSQLDHFYCRSSYPFLAVSLYNLIPACGVCNLTKLNKTNKLISPYDYKYEFYKTEFLCDESTGEILWNKFDETEIRENVKVLKLKEAYKIHEDNEIKEILNKRNIYVKSQIDEILKVLNKETGGTTRPFTEEQLKEWIYGKTISDKDYKLTSLGKLKHDILKQLGVYDE